MSMKIQVVQCPTSSKSWSGTCSVVLDAASRNKWSASLEDESSEKSAFLFWPFLPPEGARNTSSDFLPPDGEGLLPEAAVVDSFNFNRLCPAGAVRIRDAGGGRDRESSKVGTTSSVGFFLGFGPRFFGTLTSPVPGNVKDEDVGCCEEAFFDDFLGGGFSWVRSLSNRKYLSWNKR